VGPGYPGLSTPLPQQGTPANNRRTSKRLHLPALQKQPCLQQTTIPSRIPRSNATSHYPSPHLPTITNPLSSKPLSPNLPAAIHRSDPHLMPSSSPPHPGASGQPSTCFSTTPYILHPMGTAEYPTIITDARSPHHATHTCNQYLTNQLSSTPPLPTPTTPATHLPLPAHTKVQDDPLKIAIQIQFE